ncbi:MAG TPA: hypothetical protein ENN19_07265 [Chloroflexi bacterium]|nr:hypothetical protein [Chloroflexota bacterium]
MADLKAISQNVMHEDITITNKIYGGLPNETVKAKIAELTRPALSEDRVNVKAIADEVVERMHSSDVLDKILEMLEKMEGAFQ